MSQDVQPKDHRNRGILSGILFCIFFILLFVSTQLDYVQCPLVLLVVIRLPILAACIFFGLAFFYHGVMGNRNLPPPAQNLALVFFSLLLGFIVLDGLFMFFPQTHAIGYTLATQRWFQYYVRKNQMGYRDREITEAYLKNKQRIFVFGDSFANGHGIKNPEDRFPDQLRKKLPPGYALLNLSKNGEGTRDEMFRFLTFPVKPGLLILQYYGNDIDEVCGLKDRYPYKPYRDIPRPLIPLVRHSYFLNFIYWRFPHTETDFAVDMLASCFRDPVVLRKHLADLNALIGICRKDSIRMVVVLFPFLKDVERSRFYTDKIKAFFEKDKIPVVDVGELIKDVPLRQRVVNANDAHPSILVHHLVAEKLYHVLVSGGYIPASPR